MRRRRQGGLGTLSSSHRICRRVLSRPGVARRGGCRGCWWKRSMERSQVLSVTVLGSRTSRNPPAGPGGIPRWSSVKAAGLVFALSAALAVSSVTRNAPAEDAHDPEDTVYATGLIFATEEELADKPRTPLFRAYMPPSVDLRDRFPRARHQGGQGSCVHGRSATRPAPTTTAAPVAGPCSHLVTFRAQPTYSIQFDDRDRIAKGGRR